MRAFGFAVIAIIMGVYPASPVNAWTLRLQWVPQTQFAGYYMAAQKGFYEKEGIELVIRDGGPGIAGLMETANGETDFAVGWLLSGLRMRGEGHRLVHVAQIFQKPALMLVARKSSGIDGIQKFPGHSLGIWPGDHQIPPKALLRKFNLRDITIVQQGFSVTPFVEGKIDIASVMRYNEYHLLFEAGLRPDDIIVFNFADFGMNIPEDAVFVHEKFRESHGDICEKFVRASVAGWKYAFGHKDETVAFITGLAARTEFQTTGKHQRLMLDEVEKLVSPDDVSLKPEDFNTAIEVLESTRLIHHSVTYGEFTGKK